MKFHIGDTVTVTTGKDKGQSGSITKILKKTNRVVVDGVNKRVRNIKARPGQAGDRVEFFASIDISNVALVDPKTGKPTKIGYTVESGKKVRVAKASGAVLPQVSTIAAKKKSNDSKK